MPHSAPQVGGTFTYRPEGDQWWSSDVSIDLDRLEGDGRAARIRAAVTGCLADGLPFAVVVPIDGESVHTDRWTLWTGERLGSGTEAHVTGQVLDVSGPFQERVSAQIATHLGLALSARESIDLAKGALMLAYGLNADQAFDALVWCSQRTNVRVHDLAERVVALTRAGALGDRQARDAIEAALVRGAVTPDEDVPARTSQAPSAAITLRESSAGGASVLSVAGAVDLGTAPELSVAVGRLLDGLTAGDVLLVDLTEVDHLGPAGAWVLESMSRRSRSTGVELRVVALPAARRDAVGRVSDRES